MPDDALEGGESGDSGLDGAGRWAARRFGLTAMQRRALSRSVAQ
jgi:hypothetical protein